MLSIMNYIHKSFQAVCQAIEYFSREAINIFIPIKPSYAYDLILLNSQSGKEVTMRVKVVQTESQSPSGTYVVNLRKSGGYEHAKENKAPFDPSMCDVIFIISPGGAYMIPSKKITQKRAISLSMFEEYKCCDKAP